MAYVPHFYICLGLCNIHCSVTGYMAPYFTSQSLTLRRHTVLFLVESYPSLALSCYRPWATAGMDKGVSAPWKCCKVLFVLQMLSEVSIEKYSCIILRKCRQLLGSLPPDPNQVLCPWVPLGDFRSSDPLIAHLWKKSCERP